MRKETEEDCILLDVMYMGDHSNSNHTLMIGEGEEKEDFWNTQSIYRLPRFIKERNEINTYEPLLVSIGPYHHGKYHLKPMEVHKRRALHHFIKRSDLPIEVYRSALMEIEQQLRQAYEQLDDEKWGDTDKFLDLMMLDGCFILEFMDISSGSPKDYATDDPVFSYYGSIIHFNYVMRDLLLLENQLPYLVLEKLVSVAEMQQGVPPEKIHAVLAQMLMFAPNMGPGRHMLDMFMKGLFQGVTSSQGTMDGHCAYQLNKAGIQFKKINSFSNISFDKNQGTLNLPPININHYTISTFVNLKAFELRGTTRRDFNSYISLMNTLIESVKDVNLLKSEGIIVNLLGCDEDVVKLFKDLAKDIVVDMNCKSCIAGIEMNECYNARMQQWKNKVEGRVVEWLSSLHQNYFSNPWTSISVVAAACLLGLTVIQTIYTLRTFYSPKHK